MSAWRSEFRKMAALGLPAAGTQLSTMLMGMVDTVMVGRVSVDAMAAVALANVWIFGTMMFLSGVLFGLDPWIAQAHGARDSVRVGRALQTGLAMSMLLSLGVALLWTQVERFLLLTGQDPELSRLAAQYTLVQIPSLPFFMAYTTVRQWLQAREHMRPAMWVILVANVFNAIANWALIFGHLGSPPLGLLGAGIATALTRVFSCIGLILFVRAFRLDEGGWAPWHAPSMGFTAIRRLFVMGSPVAIQMALEMWAFSGAALLAGRIGAVPLAAHTVALNMAALAFMVPLGISQGAATRVGNLLGSGAREAAQRAAWVSFAMGAGVMCVSAIGFVVFREWLPRIYTPEADVIAACAAILPIAAAFQIFDGTQVVGCGVLRGMGRVRPAAVFNLLGYWVLGLPIGGYLALYGGWGLAGIWWGLAGGLAVVAIGLLLFVGRRGPRHGAARL